MTLLERSAAAMNTLHQLCMGFGNGSPPDQFSVLGVVSELTFLYGQLAEAQAKKFGGSQRARLTRKIEEAKRMHSFRKVGKTLGDSENDAMLETGEEYGKEIDAMEDYEMFVAMMNALDRSVRFGISAAAAVKRQESTASHQ